MGQIVITLSERCDARGRQIDQARCGELLVERSRGSVIGALCRKLIEDGTDPATPVEVLRDGMVAFKPTTVRRFAGLTVSESDTGGVEFRRWKPFAARPSDAGKTKRGADGKEVPESAAANGACDGPSAYGLRPPRSKPMAEAARGAG